MEDDEMSLLDWILLAVITGLVCLALWRMRRGGGCCGNCKACRARGTCDTGYCPLEAEDDPACPRQNELGKNGKEDER